MCVVPSSLRALLLIISFFSNDPATTELYTLSLHDALPICPRPDQPVHRGDGGPRRARDREVRLCRHVLCHRGRPRPRVDRKSTRLNSSHRTISYAVFCLKKKKKKT